MSPDPSCIARCGYIRLHTSIITHPSSHINHHTPIITHPLSHIQHPHPPSSHIHHHTHHHTSNTHTLYHLTSIITPITTPSIITIPTPTSSIISSASLCTHTVHICKHYQSPCIQSHPYPVKFYVVISGLSHCHNHHFQAEFVFQHTISLLQSTLYVYMYFYIDDTCTFQTLHFVTLYCYHATHVHKTLVQVCNISWSQALLHISQAEQRDSGAVSGHQQA